MIRIVAFILLFLVINTNGNAQDKKAIKLAEKYAKKADKVLANFDYHKSIDLYTCAINEFPNNADYYFKRGIANKYTGEKTAAIADFTKTVELSPYHNGAYLERGLVQQGLGNYKAAFSDFNEHTKYNLETERTLVAKVDALLALTLYDQAIPFYLQLVLLVPDVNHHRINRALCYIETDNLPAAKLDLDSAILSGEANYQRYHVEGLYYLRNKEPRKAITAFSKILIASRRSTFNPDSFGYFSNAYHAAGQIDSAIIQINKAIFHQEKPEYYLDRGNYHSDLGNLDAALLDYTKALELDSALTGAYNNRTFFVWFPQKKYQNAVEDMTAIIQLDPKNAYAYNNRSYAYYGLKDFEHAFIDAFKSVELENRNPYVYKNLGLLYYAIGEKEEATNAVKGALNWGFPVDSDIEFQELLVNLGFTK